VAAPTVPTLSEHRLALVEEQNSVVDLSLAKQTLHRAVRPSRVTSDLVEVDQQDFHSEVRSKSVGLLCGKQNTQRPQNRMLIRPFRTDANVIEK
jgi:hypothetical protein